MKKCPRCHKMTLKDNNKENVLSRTDNKTYICPNCGVMEVIKLKDISVYTGR